MPITVFIIPIVTVTRISTSLTLRRDPNTLTKPKVFRLNQFLVVVLSSFNYVCTYVDISTICSPLSFSSNIYSLPLSVHISVEIGKRKPVFSSIIFQDSQLFLVFEIFCERQGKIRKKETKITKNDNWFAWCNWFDYAKFYIESVKTASLNLLQKGPDSAQKLRKLRNFPFSTNILGPFWWTFLMRRVQLLSYFASDSCLPCFWRTPLTQTKIEKSVFYINKIVKER